MRGRLTRAQKSGDADEYHSVTPQEGVMADKYVRRGHWGRKSGSKKKQTSGWVIVAAIVGAAWLWSGPPAAGDRRAGPIR